MKPFFNLISKEYQQFQIKRQDSITPYPFGLFGRLRFWLWSFFEKMIILNDKFFRKPPKN